MRVRVDHSFKIGHVENSKDRRTVKRLLRASEGGAFDRGPGMDGLSARAWVGLTLIWIWMLRCVTALQRFRSVIHESRKLCPDQSCHFPLYVVSPWRNKLASMLFGLYRTGWLFHGSHTDYGEERKLWPLHKLLLTLITDRWLMQNYHIQKQTAKRPIMSRELHCFKFVTLQEIRRDNRVFVLSEGREGPCQGSRESHSRSAFAQSQSSVDSIHAILRVRGMLKQLFRLLRKQNAILQNRGGPGWESRMLPGSVPRISNSPLVGQTVEWR